MLQQIQGNLNLFFRVLFSDESSFTNHGTINRHNIHYWSVVNSHWLREVKHQRPWSMNVWRGIFGDQLIGPYFIDGNLNNNKFRNFLGNELSTLFRNLSLEVRQNMWFQHDDCPAQYSAIVNSIVAIPVESELLLCTNNTRHTSQLCAIFRSSDQQLHASKWEDTILSTYCKMFIENKHIHKFRNWMVTNTLKIIVEVKRIFTPGMQERIGINYLK